MKDDTYKLDRVHAAEHRRAQDVAVNFNLIPGDFPRCPWRTSLRTQTRASTAPATLAARTSRTSFSNGRLLGTDASWAS